MTRSHKHTTTSITNNRFFDNTGAVAGTFSVVGLVVLALLIACITSAVRRRRARKFDRELQAATLEAASAPKPVFLDDEDDAPVRGGAGVYDPEGYAPGGGGGYSDVSSHGTYGQPAMSVGSHSYSHGGGGGGEAYGMREMHSYAGPGGTGSGSGPGPGYGGGYGAGGGGGMGGGGGGVAPGEIFDPYAAGVAGAAAGGVAGIGAVRARSMRHAAEQGQQTYNNTGGTPDDGHPHQPQPYAAFASAPAAGYDPYAGAGGPFAGIGTNSQTSSGGGVGSGGYGVVSGGGSGTANALAQRNAEILEAAGMGAHLAGAGMLARGMSVSQAQGQGLHHRTSPSQEFRDLERSRSMGASSATQYPPQQYSPPPQWSQVAAGAYGQQGQSQSQSQSYAQQSQSQSYTQQSHSYTQQSSYSTTQQSQSHSQSFTQQHQRGMSTGTAGDDMEDAYGGYVDDGDDASPGERLPNPFDAAAAASGSAAGAGALGAAAAKGTVHSGGSGSGSGQSHGHSTGTGTERESRSRYSDEVDDLDGEEEEEEKPRVLKVANQ
ncbi:hypothetical protein JR316_0002891 [Psilocybe cubensis]|uniref:Uncharacterized protein n=2 Tax=Psilocybe cubensis TaxID=181762 RepID=A0A8H7Y455_PSICU|nr:hypothetical protein JR316_0002891 [Psilocybe cubensis]KAH9483424.1 hypothetical protein JR316_0002891 [Psilocybe cubensis]